MRTLILLTLSVIMFACSPAQSHFTGSDRGLCRKATHVSRERVIELFVTFDSHGQFAQTPDCGEEVFPVDLSRIDLTQNQYRPLMQEIARSAYTDRRPIRLKATVVFKAATGDRMEIVVVRILEF